MHRNYCFRRKRHSYAACDAALAASNTNIYHRANVLFLNFIYYIYSYLYQLNYPTFLF